SAPCSRSMVKARLSATIAASANVTHRTLGARSVEESTVGSRAKLNTTSTSAANTTAESSAVRLRNSARMSLAAITRASRRASGTDPLPIARQEGFERAGLRLVAHPAPLDQHGHPCRHGPDLGQMMGHDHEAESLGTAGLEHSAQPVRRGGVERGERLVEQEHPRRVQ